MRKSNVSKRFHVMIFAAIFTAALFIGTAEGDEGKSLDFQPADTGYYDALKSDCAGNSDIFFQDFNEAFSEVDSAQNQWSIGGSTWWFPHHNGAAPRVENSFLFLSSTKNESTSSSKKEEAQTMDAFSLPDNGELIIGLWSSRWGNVPVFNDDYWADSSVGLEIYGSAHTGIVFVYGHLGVFYDTTGTCPDPNKCQYSAVNGWANFVNTTKPIAIRITWTSEGGKKTFKLYLITETSEDTEPRATIANVDYLGSENLRIRLNANVTSTDKEPSIDSDTLKIDYVCMRTEGWATPPEISLNRTRFNFGEILSVTGTNAQTLLIDNTGDGTLNWTAAVSDNWIKVNPGNGTGSGETSISVDATGLSPGYYTGMVTVSDPAASNSPQTVSVTLTVYEAGKTGSPFGQFATPLEGSVVSSSIAVTGWVLDDVGIESVKIYSGNTYIGDVLLVEGARTDIEQAYPGYPGNYAAGWGYMLLTNFLPGGGNGVYTLNVKATDMEGHVVLLGSKTITVDNVNAVKPFGAIDTPAQGGSASGNTYKIQGWVLTPMPNKVPENGSTIGVYVDSVKLGNPQYNIPRSDIATYFPGYANSEGPAAVYTFDSTAYSNGIHTVYWIAADNAGNADGIGSRFFSIQNASAGSTQRSAFNSHWFLEKNNLSRFLPDCWAPAWVKRGCQPNAEPVELYPDLAAQGAEKGMIRIKIPELERIEIKLAAEEGVSPLYTAGYHLVGEQLRPLPVGSTLDAEQGVFYWHPAPGFLGEYHLVFLEKRGEGEFYRKDFLITILPGI